MRRHVFIAVPAAETPILKPPMQRHVQRNKRNVVSVNFEAAYAAARTLPSSCRTVAIFEAAYAAARCAVARAPSAASFEAAYAAARPQRCLCLATITFEAAYAAARRQSRPR